MSNAAARKLAKLRWAGVSPEDRTAAASHAAKALWDGLTKEQRAARIAKMVKARLAQSRAR